MHLAGLDALVWAIGLIAHIVLLYVLLKRHRAGRFPAFTILIAANVIRTIALYLTFRLGSRFAYFYAYWALAIGDVVLQLLVVREMAAKVFRPLGKWATDVKCGLLWLICGSIAIAVGLTWLGPVHGSDWREMFVNRGSFFTAILMSELFVGMVALSVTVGLPWKSHTTRIAHGLGIYSVVCLLIETTKTSFATPDPQTVALLTHLRMGIYLLCVTYWIVMLWWEEPATKPLPNEVRERLYRLQSHYHL